MLVVLVSQLISLLLFFHHLEVLLLLELLDVLLSLVTLLQEFLNLDAIVYHIEDLALHVDLFLLPLLFLCFYHLLVECVVRLRSHGRHI